METIQKKVKLHRVQHQFRQSDALYRGFVGGRGAGKSWIGAYDLIRRARKGCTYLIASPTSVLMGDTTYPTFQMIAKDLGVWGSVRLTPYPTVTLTTGASVRFRTAEDPDKMRGPNLSGCWLDEASLMPEEAYTVAIGCLREQGRQGWLSATFTPKGLSHWTYQVFGKERQDTALFRAHTRANPFNPPGFADTLQGQYGGQLSRQELGGEFLTLEGAEWPETYFPDSIWFDDWPTDLTCRTIGLDPSKSKDSKSGDYAAFAYLGRDTAGQLWCEAFLRRCPAEDVIEDALAHHLEFRSEAFAIEVNQFLQLFAVHIAQLSKQRGMSVPIVSITNTVNKQVRIRRLGPYLARGGIRFRNTPGTRMLVQQLRDFPLAEHDDGGDALEMALRAMIDLWNGKQHPRKPKRVTA